PPAPAPRPVRTVRLDFSDGTAVVHGVVAGGTTTIGFPARRTAWVRLSIATVASAADPNRPVAVSEIAIPGLSPQEMIRVPTDLVTTLGAGTRALDELPLTYLF